VPVTKPQQSAAIKAAAYPSLKMRGVLLGAVLLGVAAGDVPALAAQFTAALLTSDADGRATTPPAKIYVADERVRLDG
jgi:hypothetical protein